MKQNMKIAKEHMRVCIDEARDIIKSEELRDYQTNIVRIATALFHRTRGKNDY